MDLNGRERSLGEGSGMTSAGSSVDKTDGEGATTTNPGGMTNACSNSDHLTSSCIPCARNRILGSVASVVARI